MQRFIAGFVLLAALGFPAWSQTPKPPVQIGLDAEFTLDNSVSAQAIEKGMRIAIAEINANGGVLQGRQLELVLRDNGSIPARGIKNIREFSTMPHVVAVFGGRFSPVLLEQMAVVNETGMLLLAPWSSADPIIKNGMKPNRVFRLSLQDSLAMPKMLETSSARGLNKVGLLLTNTGWGRSNKVAAENYAKANRSPAIVHTAWYNFKDTSLIEKYESLRKMGAQAVILVANDDEAAVLVREMAALPRAQRIPILSHWGVAGGEFVRQAGPALQEVDFTVIQTFSFFKAEKAALAHFFSSAKNFGLRSPEDVQAPSGVAHAYDLTHILAKAINLAGSADRDAVRSALERVKNHKGVVKFYKQPFTATNHEALTKNELLMARFRSDGVLIPVN